MARHTFTCFILARNISPKRARVAVRGDSGVTGERRVVGVPKFHSWGKCTMPLTNINSDWMSNASSGLCIILYWLPYSGKFLAGANFRGKVSRLFRGNFRGFYFRGTRNALTTPLPAMRHLRGVSYGFVGILYSRRLIHLYSNHLEGRQTVENHHVHIGTRRTHVMT